MYSILFGSIFMEQIFLINGQALNKIHGPCLNTAKPLIIKDYL